MRSKCSKQNTNKQTKTNKYKVNTYAKSLQTTKYRQRVVPSKKKDYKPVEQEGKLMTLTKEEKQISERITTEIELLQKEGYKKIDLSIALAKVAVFYTMGAAPTPMAGVAILTSIFNFAIQNAISSSSKQ